ncbi:MAG TPA: alkaline phosphatase family protein [Thermoflexia bacterium]|nr:alkaline phosphatase family protein [Thermoflexia bacterium]
MNLQTLEHDLRTYRPAGMENFPGDFVWPRYEGLSVGNIPATIAQLLGNSTVNLLPPLRADLLAGLDEDVRRVVLVLLDGLGWEQLQRMMAKDEELIFHQLQEQGRLLPLTSIFPSTTVNVLSTLRTGAPPIRHGLLAYELYLRQWATAAECITFSPIVDRGSAALVEWGLDAETFLPVPALAHQLSIQGTLTYQVISNHIKSGALSRMYFRGVREVYGHYSASDFWLTVRRALHEHHAERCYISAYWSAVDTLAHLYGPRHETGLNEVRSLSYLLQRAFLDNLSPADREGTLLLITADHGQLETPVSQAIILTEHPELANMLTLPPVGEARVPFFYVRGGDLEKARTYLEEHFGEQLICLERQTILESGLLGPGEPYSEVPHRLGDLIAITKGHATFVRTEEDAKRLPGRHGGLMSQEMLVPLLAVRLEDL